MKLNPQQVKDFQTKIKEFYKTNRRDMPWRQTSDPYTIVVSEIMLQQTQVARVLEKYPLWLEKFPSFSSLAKASTLDVLQMWQGLGYNRRGLYIKRIAEIVTQEHLGELPKDPEILEKFPGIGHATARSIIVFSYNTPHVFMETNIRRVFIHEFFDNRHPYSSVIPANPDLIGAKAGISAKEDPHFREDDKIDDDEIYPLIGKTLDIQNPREWYYALMDYGAFISKQTTNPNRKSKMYTKQSKFEGSLRQVRGKILKLLLEKSPQSKDQLEKQIETSKDFFEKALDQLRNEKFIKVQGQMVQVFSEKEM